MCALVKLQIDIFCDVFFDLQQNDNFFAYEMRVIVTFKFQLMTIVTVVTLISC